MVVSHNVYLEIDVKRPPGSRIQKFFINGQSLDPEREYLFSNLSFPLSGRDGFSAFAPEEIKEVTFMDDAELFLKFAKISELPENLLELHEFKQSRINLRSLFELTPDPKGADQFNLKDFSSLQTLKLQEECLLRLKAYSLVEGIRECEGKYVFEIGDNLGRMKINY